MVQVGCCKLPAAEGGVSCGTCRGSSSTVHEGEVLCCAVLQAVAGAAAPRNKLRAADSEREVRAALAGLDEADREEERDSGEESDYYWSDA